jgi:hypothetical protein
MFSAIVVILLYISFKLEMQLHEFFIAVCFHSVVPYEALYLRLCTPNCTFGDYALWALVPDLA